MNKERTTEKEEQLKAEIALSKENKAKEAKARYEKKLREYEERKKYLNEYVEKMYRESDLNRRRIVEKNESDMAIYRKKMQDTIDKLKKSNEEKEKSFVILHEKNVIEVEKMKKELFKKQDLLDTIHKRYADDMLMRYQRKKSLEESNKSKKEALEALNVKLKSMEEEEKTQEKLNAIKEKIALRTISKFLLPYVNLKFKSSRQKMVEEKKTKKTKKTKNQKKL